MRSDKYVKGRRANHAAPRGGAKRPVLILLCAAVLLAALTVGVNAAIKHIAKKKLFKSEVTLSEEVTPDDEFIKKFGESERVNFLFVGSADGLTDTLMVGSYDMKNQLVDLISVPRDTYYPRPGYNGAWSKINSIYHSKQGGMAEVAAAVSDVLDGMPIHYYLMVDYEGVANIVDAIGGVRFNVPFHMKYDDSTKGQELHIDIPQGEQLITKENVVEFLRFRQTNPWHKRNGYKDYGTMDVGRMETHQAFMKEAFKQSIGTRFPKVVSAVMDNVESDLDMEMVWKLVSKAQELDSSAIQSHTLPGEPAMREGTSVWVLDEDGVAELLDQIYHRAETGTDNTDTDAGADGAAEDRNGSKTAGGN